jgi:thioredoxin 1
MIPLLDELQNELGDQAQIVKLDVDEHLDLAVEMKVMGVPTLMLYKKGQLLWKDAGVQSKEMLKNLIMNALNN